MKQTLTLCMLFVSGAVVIADHLPAKLQARGKPENTLAGINLEHDEAADVLKKLGPPTRKITAPNNPQWIGYLWDTSTTRLEVEISRGKREDFLDQVTIVRLQNWNGAGSSNTISLPVPDSTGRGLKLGDTKETLKNLYGDRLHLSRQKPVPVTTDPFLSVPGNQTVSVQWSSLEFTLTAGLDSEGRIIALRLRPPECYPGGCE